MTDAQFLESLRSGATLHREPAGASDSDFLSLEYPDGHREDLMADLAAAVRFRRLYREVFQSGDLVTACLRDVAHTPVLVLVPVAWDSAGHQRAYREAAFEVARLRAELAESRRCENSAIMAAYYAHRDELAEVVRLKGDLERLRGLVGRLADADPVEWRGIASSDPYCPHCEAPYDDHPTPEVYRDPANHKPDCPWLEARALSGDPRP